MKYFLFILTAILVSACGIQHNSPTSTNPNRQVPPNTTIVFVDQNGAFYPKDWSRVYGKPPKNGRKNVYSLSKIASEKGKEKDLAKFEKDFLNALQSQLKNDKRVFILIHGFNAKSSNVNRQYEQIASRLNLNKTDEIIQFYWDGLYTSNPFSSMKTWFTAADNSQYAGKFALRKILNVMSNKEIYLISHSRGASVVLSALSSAPLDTAKMSILADVHNIDTLQSDNILKNRNNKITAIALAPAIGKSDFEIKVNGDTTVHMVKFTPQLKSLHITTNKDDMMLKKVIGFMSNKLNPTDLGYKSDSFNQLAEQYKFMKRSDFTGQKSHDFERYVTNKKFIELLKQYKLAK